MHSEHHAETKHHDVIKRTSPSSEQSTLFQVLTFWVAITNHKSDNLSAQQLANLTGLDITIIQTAVTYVQNKPAVYKAIRDEFALFEVGAFKYPPSECPISLNTLEQIASLQPWVFD